MFDVLTDSCLDILKTVPVLLAVYALTYFLETRMRTTPRLLEKTRRLGPCFGALAGSIPQCGFSSAAVTLYNSGYLTPATLVAVFVSTSDEAIPLLLANPGAGRYILLLLGCKIALAVAGGYLLDFTLFRGCKARRGHVSVVTGTHSGCCGASPVRAVLRRTARTTAFLLLTMLAINLAVCRIGGDALSSLLLSGSVLQPALCALIGLIPGCAVSVLLTGLFLSGTISFGAVIAGLSTGAGFGYVLLLQNRAGRRRAFRIIAATWLVAAVGGTLLQLALPEL
ncbi:MAG: putative manganese transporter [Intestinibacillus sp.]